MGVSPGGGRSAPLVLRLYAIGIVTALVIAGSWFAAHTFVRTRWPAGSAMALEILRDVPELWAHGQLEETVDRLGRFMNVSIYDTQGALVATNIKPPLPFPTPDEQRQAEEGPVQRGGGIVVNRVLRK